VDHYEWGDFKGNPDRLMARYLDLFLYLANWGSRRLSIRLPKRLLDAADLKRFLGGSTSSTIRTAGENLIVDVFRDQLEIETRMVATVGLMLSPLFAPTSSMATCGRDVEDLITLRTNPACDQSAPVRRVISSRGCRAPG
jgi:hypothetical protein